MPFTFFTCPDGVDILIEECIGIGCRMAGRCVSKPSLMLMSRRRKWAGKISATQGLNGTRMEYLKLLHDYAERPVDRAFALLGTIHHIRMQYIDVFNHLTEERVEEEYGFGTFDLYDPDERAIWDYKTTGSYKVAKALGIKKEEEVIPEGEPGAGVFKSGPRKGMPRTRKVWSMKEPEFFDWQMQTSFYAWQMKDKGFDVQRVFVQATVRDFNARTPEIYGLHQAIYVIPIPILSREVVVEFYKAKQSALVRALADREMPPPCTPDETWDGRRCAKYCPVWKWCDVGVAAHSQPKEEADAEEVAG